MSQKSVHEAACNECPEYGDRRRSVRQSECNYSKEETLLDDTRLKIYILKKRQDNIYIFFINKGNEKKRNRRKQKIRTLQRDK